MSTPRDELYFEDLIPEARYETPFYEVSRDEIVEFARRWDPYGFHVDEEAGRTSIFGGLVACTAHIFSISSLLNHDLPVDFALVAGLGGDGLELLAPVRPGDRLRLVRRILAVRDSKSKPHAGIVTMEDCLESPDGKAFFRTRGAILVARRTSEGE